MNAVTILGRLTKDIELKQSSIAVARFTVAVDRLTKDGEKKADFISCVAFGKTAEVMSQRVGKGCRIAINGRIQTVSYTNKEGNTVYTTDVVVGNATFIDYKDKEQQPNNEEIPDGFMAYDDNDEDIPF